MRKHHIVINSQGQPSLIETKSARDFQGNPSCCDIPVKTFHRSMNLDNRLVTNTGINQLERTTIGNIDNNNCLKLPIMQNNNTKILKAAEHLVAKANYQTNEGNVLNTNKPKINIIEPSAENQIGAVNSENMGNERPNLKDLKKFLDDKAICLSDKKRKLDRFELDPVGAMGRSKEKRSSSLRGLNNADHENISDQNKLIEGCF